MVSTKYIDPLVLEFVVSTKYIDPFVLEFVVSTKYIDPFVLEFVVSTKYIDPLVLEFVVSTKYIDPLVLEFVVSNITDNSQWGNCISLDFYFRGLTEPRKPRKLELDDYLYTYTDFTVYSYSG